MSWAQFLAQLGTADGVTLVGPLHDGNFTPDQPTIFVDGGTRFRTEGRHVPTVSVGDGDSNGSPLNVKLNTNKDFSDLGFVLRELPPSVSRLRLLGFLGGRLDHELANLGEIHRFLLGRPGGQVEMRRAGQTAVVGFVGSLAVEVHGLFSVLVLTATEVSIAGAAQYLLPTTRLEPASSHGLSNQGSGQVRFEAAGPAFLFFAS